MFFKFVLFLILKKVNLNLIIFLRTNARKLTPVLLVSKLLGYILRFKRLVNS